LQGSEAIHLVRRRLPLFGKTQLITGLCQPGAQGHNFRYRHCSPGTGQASRQVPEQATRITLVHRQNNRLRTVKRLQMSQGNGRGVVHRKNQLRLQENRTASSADRAIVPTLYHLFVPALTLSTMSSSNTPNTELTGSLSLRTGDHTWGSARRMALLAAIAKQGSISAAARHIGISYKAAWDAIDIMNNMAGAPPVALKTRAPSGG